MARWRLLNPHYLNVPGTEWEYTEVSRATGKQARVRFPVGLFLNPGDAADHNYPGEIIVAQGKGANRKDIIFVGPPTPDMEPLDEEAERISEEWRPMWKHPIDTLSGYGDYSQSLFSQFEKELTEAVRKVGNTKRVNVVDNASIPNLEFESLKRQVAELSKQNALLLQKLEKPSA